MQQPQQQQQQSQRAPRRQPSNKKQPDRKEPDAADPPSTAPDLRSRIYRQPCRQRLDGGENLHVYLFEVHDFQDKKTYGERFWGCIRDITLQTAVEVPLSMIKPLIKHLLSCKIDEAELEHDENDEKDETEGAQNAPQVTLFDLEALKSKQMVGLDNKLTLEIGPDPNAKADAPTTKLLSSCPAGKTEECTETGDESEEVRMALKPGTKKKSLVITEWLLPRLILFLRDIYIRHMSFAEIEARPDVRNLYTPSGSRRFYFDLHETRWGTRLQISQVTMQHRNTVSIPLESLVLFRNRLNTLIERLDLDEFSDLRVARSPRPKFERENGTAASSGTRRGARRMNGKPVRPFRRPLSSRFFTPMKGQQARG